MKASLKHSLISFKGTSSGTSRGPFTFYVFKGLLKGDFRKHSKKEEACPVVASLVCLRLNLNQSILNRIHLLKICEDEFSEIVSVFIFYHTSEIKPYFVGG